MERTFTLPSVNSAPGDHVTCMTVQFKALDYTLVVFNVMHAGVILMLFITDYDDGGLMRVRSSAPVSFCQSFNCRG